MKKSLSIIKNVAIWMIVLVALFALLLTVISVATVDRNDRSLFGYKMYIVTSNSMSATDFDAGSLIFCKTVQPSTLQEGDIITFISQNTDSFGEIVTHKIRKLITTANGSPGFITYGTTTNTNDEAVVTYSYVLGKYTGKISKIGRFFNFLKTPLGYFVCIFLPFMLIITYESARFFVLLRKYRKEQSDQVQAQLEKITQERAENEKILEELKQLRAGIQGSQVVQNTEESTKP